MRYLACPIDDARFVQMAQTAAAEGLSNAFVPLTAEDVAAIYRACL